MKLDSRGLGRSDDSGPLPPRPSLRPVLPREEHLRPLDHVPTTTNLALRSTIGDRGPRTPSRRTRRRSRDDRPPPARASELGSAEVRQRQDSLGATPPQSSFHRRRTERWQTGRDLTTPDKPRPVQVRGVWSAQSEGQPFISELHPGALPPRPKQRCRLPWEGGSAPPSGSRPRPLPVNPWVSGRG